jgi:predicted phosphodiesterase
MKLRVASDLHLEGFSSMPIPLLVERFLPLEEKDKESVLILAGDICSDVDLLHDFLEQAERRFKKVIFVPGNHEYYRHDYHELNGIFASFDNTLSNTVTPYSEEALGYLKYTFEDVDFLITTLWSYGGSTPLEQIMVSRALNDFRLIRVDDQKFSIHFMIEEFKRMSGLLGNDLKAKDKKTIVITHHMPSVSLCHPRFGNEIDGGFASPCDHLLEMKPDLWVFGHTHDTVDQVVHGTRVICNPCGYRSEWNTDFNQYHLSPKFVNV